MYKIVMLASLFLMVACSGQGNKKTEAATESTTTEITKKAEEITVTFAPGETSVKLNGHIHGLKDSKTYVFEAKEGQTLSANIAPATQPANIRFNQLISPTNKMDGPFGLEISSTLNESGKWKLVVAESLMNGEDYIGDYELIISLK